MHVMNTSLYSAIHIFHESGKVIQYKSWKWKRPSNHGNIKLHEFFTFAICVSFTSHAIDKIHANHASNVIHTIHAILTNHESERGHAIMQS